MLSSGATCGIILKLILIATYHRGVMQKHERLMKTLSGDSTDRPPVAVWRPFPGDDQRTADFARCVIEYQQAYDWDFVNVYPASNYAVIDYGVQDEWQGAPDGMRAVVRPAVRRSLDWTELRPLVPERGELGKAIIALKMIQDALLPQDAPVILTVYSPLAQAARIAGQATLIRHLRRRPERLVTGLNIITDSLLNFLEALKPLGLAGICYRVEHADYSLLAEQEYVHFGLPFDQKVIDAFSPAWWLNLLNLIGDAPMFRLLDAYPPLVWCWQSHRAEPSLIDARAQIKSAVCGGLDAELHLRAGTPSIIQGIARETIQQMGRRRLILGAGDAVPATTPQSNLRALREIVERISI